MNVIGKKIKELRESEKLNQKELAKALNISNTTLSQYETGQRTPSDDIKIKIAEFFNVSLDYLLGRTDIKNPDDENKEMERLANKEIKSVEDALEIIKFQDGLMLNGKILNDEDKMLLANALQLGMKYVLEQEEKKKGKGEEKNK